METSIPIVSVFLLFHSSFLVLFVVLGNRWEHRTESRHNRSCLFVWTAHSPLEEKCKLLLSVTSERGGSFSPSPFHFSLSDLPLWFTTSISPLPVFNLCLYHLCLKLTIFFCLSISSALAHCLFSATDPSPLNFYHPFHLSSSLFPSSHFHSQSAVNQNLYPRLSRLRGCMWDDIHLPTENDIILLLRSLSDSSTWSLAFIGVVCTQERHRQKEIEINRKIHKYIDRNRGRR